MVDLKDKVVVITGASSGIGRAAALTFARRGCRLVLAARRTDRLQALAAQINAEIDTQANPPADAQTNAQADPPTGAQTDAPIDRPPVTTTPRAIAVPTDVTDPQQVHALFSRTLETFGPAEILVHCVGCGLKRPIIQIEPHDWHRVIAVNLDSAYLCCRQALRQMIAHRIRGHILTVCSVAGLYGGPTYAAYCAAKHGVAGFMRSLRWEARKHRIRATTIYPARVNTEFFDDYGVKPQAREMLDPQDIADYLVALACRCPLRIAHVRLRNLGKRITNLFRSARPGDPPTKP